MERTIKMKVDRARLYAEVDGKMLCVCDREINKYFNHLVPQLDGIALDHCLADRVELLHDYKVVWVKRWETKRYLSFGDYIDLEGIEDGEMTVTLHESTKGVRDGS